MTPDLIIQELKTLEGDDLVNVSGKNGRNNARVWLEPVRSENRKDLGFVKIHVEMDNEEVNDVNVKIPRGLVQLAGEVIRGLGLVDKFCKLPPEIINL